MGQAIAFTRVIYNFNEPYWRVRYPDGDWEELHGQQVKKGRQRLADASSRSSNENAAVVKLRLRVGEEGHRIGTGVNGEKGGL